MTSAIVKSTIPESFSSIGKEMAELSSQKNIESSSSSSFDLSRKAKHNLFHIWAGRSASKLCA